MTMPSQYYSRFDASQNFEEHLFIAGRGLQSAELNEIQKQALSRVKGVADALFKDGDIVRDASINVDPNTGAVQCQSGAIYLRGAVRGVSPATLTVPITGTHAIGVRLTQTVITALEDPDLRDPATGTRNFNEPGAERLQVIPTWAVGGEDDSDFFPIYSVTDGILNAKEPPPTLDAVSQALARYDRDSSGGSYVVSGMNVKALSDVAGVQNYTVSEGRCRVYGYPFEFSTARRVTLAISADLKAILNEPHLSGTDGAQRITFDRAPATAITEVTITAEKTVTLVHGVFTGAQDPLPDTSILQLLSVRQGGTTYVANTDYLLTAGKVDWSPAGAEPAPGSSYTVTYRYLTNVTPTAVDDDGFTVTGAVVGTLVLVSYSQKLPRVDRLCVDTNGNLVWLIGVASEYNPQLPSVPEDLLPIASVYQAWRTTRKVVNDGVRVVPMPQLAAVETRMDWLAQLIAQNRLESSIHTREGGTKKGLFTDPFIDDSQRDAGIEQTAAIVNGELQLPISATVSQMGSDVATPTTLAYTQSITLDQPLRTGSMKVNPYLAFDVPPGQLRIVPAVDRWTVVQTSWQSPITQRFDVGNGNRFGQVENTRDALLSRSESQVETLREISISYTLSGFGAGENLQSLTFDGVSVMGGPKTANGAGVITGTFVIPNGIPAGTKLVSAVGAGGSRAEVQFTGNGILIREVWQRQTTITRTWWRADPLAQTFTLSENTQVSGLDLWFETIPTSWTSVQIRSTANGFPTQTILAEAALTAGQFAAVGSATRISFPAPVALLAGSEYAIVVLCNDDVGAMSVAELGKFDSNAQRWITSQAYNVGVLLSSSNAVTWTAHQDRDMAFRILRADFTQSSRTVNLGNVAVTNATDLLLLSYAERPDSATSVEYTLTLPNATVLTVDDGEPVQLPSAITGNVAVAAHLKGNSRFSPMLFPGAQLVAGVVGTSGTYISRAIPGGASVRVKVIYEAVVPSGATVTVAYKPVGSSTWTTLPQTATSNVDDGFIEIINEASSVSAVNGVQIRLTLNGTTAARPRVRDLRCIVI